MHVAGHALTAAPFAACGWWVAAAAAIAPDITWIANEVRYRLWARERARSCADARWSTWSMTLRAHHVRAYRVAHSFITLAATCAGVAALSDGVAAQLAAGWLVHLCCDLPTHRGVMQQRPLYPFSQWRWPWCM